MFEGHTLVSYFGFESFSGSVNKRADEAIVYYSLRCLQTDPDFSDFSFGSYLFLLLASLTAQGLSFAGNATLDYHLLSSVSFGFFDGNSATYTIFQLWWSFPSGGAFLLVEFFFTQLRLYTVVEISFLLLPLLCSPVRCG